VVWQLSKTGRHADGEAEPSVSRLAGGPEQGSGGPRMRQEQVRLEEERAGAGAVRDRYQEANYYILP